MRVEGLATRPDTRCIHLNLDHVTNFVRAERRAVIVNELSFSWVDVFGMSAGITQTTERLWRKHGPVRPLVYNLDQDDDHVLFVRG